MIKRKIDWKKVIRADLDRRKSLDTSPLIKKLRKLLKAHKTS